MARDMAEVMTRLGHREFHLVGHDRGGRVAHRLARDHGGRVRSLAVLDISPTVRVFENTEVIDILVKNERAVGVCAKSGDDVLEIRAGTVVLASGLWSHQIARKLPTLRVPDEWAYYKEEAGKLLIGACEPVAKP